MAFAQGFPQIQSAFTDQEGFITSPWLYLLRTLFERSRIAPPVTVSIPGTPTNGETLGFMLTETTSFARDFFGAQAYALAASTGTATITINRTTGGGTAAIGALVFDMSQTGIFTSVAVNTTVCDPGDIISFVFPNPADATLAGVYIGLQGERV